MARNRIVVGNTTIMDISSTTAVPSDVAYGKTFFLADGTQTQGIAVGNNAITIIQSQDTNGGVIKNIIGVDISQDTVDAAHLLSGYTAHDSDGNAVTGTYVPSTPFLQSKSVTYTPTSAQQTETVTADSGYDGLDEVNVTVNAVPPGTKGLPNVSVTKSSTTLHKVITYPSATGYFTREDLGSDSYMTLESETVTPTESEQVVEPTSTSYYLNSVTVGAISSTYVGSGIDRRSSSDLTASGATVTVPAGFYSAQASKAVSSGSAGAPTATKGTVSNHSVSVTPSVTNTTGYITGGTQTGTVVTVSASELVSGTYSVTSSGTKDVTNYASASVPAGTEGTPTATKGTVSNHSVSVTPSVTNSGGYITGSTKTGTSVTVFASELVSGSETKTENGTYDVTNLASVNVAIPIVTYYTGSSTPSSSLGSNGDIYLKTT